MATITVKLRKDKENAKGLCPIVINYTHLGKEAPLSTGQSATITGFTDKEGAWTPSPDTNALISDAAARARKILSRFQLDNNRAPATTEMRELFNIQSGKTEAPSANLFDLFSDFMRYQSTQRGMENVSPGVYTNYKKVKERFIQYQTFTKQPFNFSSIDKSFYNSFSRYCTEQHNNGPGTIGSYIKIIKTFLIWCANHRGIVIEKPVMATLKVTDIETWKPYLTLPEIDALLKIDFTDRPFFEHSRNAFVLQCCIGCRIGDLSRMLQQNIVHQNGKWLFRMRTKKNEKITPVPISKRAWAILNKYAGLDPKDWIPADQQINSDIKKICALAGITEAVQISTGTGTTRQDITKRKCDLITTHTARRSFININLDFGVDDRTIAAMTGQDILTLQRYKHADTRGAEQAISKWDEEPVAVPKKRTLRRA